jgi:hypothetical protein
LISVFILDSAVEHEGMSEEQIFRSEDMPFGIANGKFQLQNMESVIWDVKFRVLARTSYSSFPLAHFLTAEIGFIVHLREP